MNRSITLATLIEELLYILNTSKPHRYSTMNRMVMCSVFSTTTKISVNFLSNLSVLIIAQIAHVVNIVSKRPTIKIILLNNTFD